MRLSWESLAYAVLPWVQHMIIRRKHKKNFTVIPNAIFNDDRLSLEARGLLGFLLSCPPNWEVRHDALRRRFGLSRQRLASMLRELTSAGYISRGDEQPRDDQRRFTSYHYVVSDEAVVVEFRRQFAGAA